MAFCQLPQSFSTAYVCFLWMVAIMMYMLRTRNFYI